MRKVHAKQKFEVIVTREWEGNHTNCFQPYPKKHQEQFFEMIEWIEENVSDVWHVEKRIFDRPRFCSPVVWRFSFADISDAALFRLRF